MPVFHFRRNLSVLPAPKEPQQAKTITSASSSRTRCTPPKTKATKKAATESALSPKAIKRFEKIQKDPKYLIRFCSAREWDKVEKICALFLQLFLFQKDCGDDDVINDFASIARKQLMSTDKWGNTPLHVACYFTPPASLIRIMLKAYHKAGESILTVTNNDGATPLLISCSCRSSRAVQDELLHPPSGIHGEPSVTMCDDQGNTPFTGLINRYEMLHKIPFYRDACIPLDEILYQNGCSTTTPELPTQEDFPSERSFRLDSRDGPHRVFPQFWSSVEDMIRSTWSEAYPDKSTRPMRSILHGAALIADVIPVKLTNLILRVYKHELCSQLNKDHHLPLHLAVMSRRHRYHETKNYDSHDHHHLVHRHPRILYQQAYFIEKLLEINPSAMTVPTTSGRPLFCQAVASGLSWHVPAVHLTKENESSSTCGPLQTMFEHCPEVLVQADTETGLYPFQLAAATTTSSSFVNEEEDVRALGTIYNLLRQSPELIR